MALEIRTGEPPEDGRYVVWRPCAAQQVREWCEPEIATWQGGRWHTYHPVICWVGPLAVVHMGTGEIARPEDYLRGDKWTNEEIKKISPAAAAALDAMSKPLEYDL